MKIVLFALNGSYTHTNLATRCLRVPLENAGFEVVIIERNLRDRREDVLQALYAEHGDVIGFSTYIWNLQEMLAFAADLKALSPSCVCVFGGPEVSFDTERFDAKTYIDHIICGEGERALTDLCLALRDGKKADRILKESSPTDLSGTGILYRDGDYAGGDMLYYESSRGCPYRCAYCLSSTCGRIRAKSVEETLDDLLRFSTLPTPVKIIKFVDRTFNFDPDRANRIWKALLDDRFDGHYHFEICASLLNEESFSIFSRFPKGKIQLEIGLQSTNPQTLAEVSRHIDPAQVLTATRRIHDMGNIHVHLDLIAGLPYESYLRFQKSFNDAYFCADMLQLGFLKLLHGTALRENADKYDYVYTQEPPYTVLANRWISHDELYRLSGIADLLDRYENSGAFPKSVSYAVRRAPSPFAFYDGLLDYIANADGRSIRKISQADAFRHLFGYVSAYLSDTATFEQLLHEDYAAREARSLPRAVLSSRS